MKFPRLKIFDSLLLATFAFADGALCVCPVVGRRKFLLFKLLSISLIFSAGLLFASTAYGATNVYHSVSPYGTGNLLSGGSPTIVVDSSGNATLTLGGATQVDNIGQGTVVEYNSITSYIDSITDATHFHLITSTGTNAAEQTSVAVTSIHYEYASLSAAEAALQQDLTSSDLVMNIACYYDQSDYTADTTTTVIDGWVTDSTRYVRIYTPTGGTQSIRSQRHQGKWDDSKYRIEITASADYSRAIGNREDFVRIEGLQLHLINNDYGYGNAIHFEQLNPGAAIYVPNNIIKGTLNTTDDDNGVGISIQDSDPTYYIYNNVIYGFNLTSSTKSCGFLLYGTVYLYNNTSYNNANGVRTVNGTFVLKNNISSQNLTLDFQIDSSIDGSSTNNLSSDVSSPNSGPSDCGGHSCRNQTVSFLDLANKDFHLSPTDTAAKNAGVDLSGDSGFAFSTDIDRQTRSTWDIGADEGATKIYRSVGPGATSALATGATNHLNISGSTASFDSDLPSNVGVGDALEYDDDNDGDIDVNDSIAFISGRINAKEFTIKTATGGTPTAPSAGDEIHWNIFRAYTSLSNAESGTENTGIDSDLRSFDAGNRDIYTNNEEWNIACYANGTTADETGVTIDDWTTYSSNFIKIYTPTSTTEVGTSQRHQGRWDDRKYALSRTATGNTQSSLYINDDFVRIEGLQVNIVGGIYSNTMAMRQQYSNGIGGEVYIAKSILKSSDENGEYGLSLSDNAVSFFIKNNIIYGGFNRGIQTTSVASDSVIYNNTIYNCDIGIAAVLRYFNLKNNIVQGGTTNYTQTTNTTHSNNISSDATSPDASYQSKTVSFADATNKDFHLSPTDTSAKNSGADLSADSYFAFSTDIDGQTRSTWDIGADEAANAVYYSVGQSVSDLKTGTPTITITSNAATFTTPQTGNIGVGDRVTYGQIDISTFGDQGGGIVRITTSTNHGFLTGDYVNISGTTNYNGTYQISNASGAVFDITHSYTAESGGTSKYAANIAYISSKSTTSVWYLTSPIGTSVSNRTSPVALNLINHEYTTLTAAEASAPDANHLNTSNLVTGNYQLNFPCYYDNAAETVTARFSINDWTETSVSNYIKVYTPNNVSTEANKNQRHSGKWTESGYSIQTSTSSVQTFISIWESHTVIDGLQISFNGSAGGIDKTGVAINLGADSVTVKNSIIRNGMSVTGSEELEGIEINDDTHIAKARIYNNIVYGFPDRGIYALGSPNLIIYNNVVYGSDVGISSFYIAYTPVLKNNITQSCTDGYSGTFHASSDYNISDFSQSDADDVNVTFDGYKTVSFLDLLNKDFHLSPADTSAKNAGADLSADPNFAFSTDIDGQTRSGTWDIGADEGATKIYRSVGPGATSAIDDDNSQAETLSISGSTATFNTAEVSDNVGAGDVILYDSDSDNDLDASDAIVFIHIRTDSQNFTVKDADGSDPDITTATNDKWAIYRAYTSLSNAEAGTKNTSIPITFTGGNRDIYTNNEEWNIACYANGATADSTAVTVDGWTTAASNFIKIYTPTLTSEVGASQRHQGKWDEGKYRLEITTANSTLRISDPYVIIDGLQIKSTTNGMNYAYGIDMRDLGVTGIRISNNIISCGNPAYSNNAGIVTIANTSAPNYIINNIVYGFSGTSNAGISLGHDYGAPPSLVYNNTIVNSTIGIRTDNQDTKVINNITQNCTDGFNGTFASGSDYNISDVVSDGAPSPSYRNGLVTTVSFIDSTNNDFHLSPIDTSAKNAGTNLSADAYFSFSTDLDGQTRSTWDIGADEGATRIYRSVGPGATAAIDTGAADNNDLAINGTTGVATFEIAAPDDVGVGDAIQYDSDNNGTIDAIAFISSRSDSQTFTLQNASGGLPTATSLADQDWSIFRAYASLSNAESGVENAGINNTVEQFDSSWSGSGGKNIYTSNEEWNVACYANGATADTHSFTISNEWVTYPTNFFNIYTPTSSSEVGISQRHQGKWDESKYRMELNSYYGIISQAAYSRIDGIQLKMNTVGYEGSWTVGIDLTPYATGVADSLNGKNSDMRVSNNILQADLTGLTAGASGIITGYHYYLNAKIWNNVVYNWSNGSGETDTGINVYTGNANAQVYNNTVYNCEDGISGYSSVLAIVKNNLSYNNTGDDYVGNFSASSINNISSDATSPNSGGADCGGHSCRSQTVSFADSANKDFHLSPADTSAKNSGVDLSADTYFAFSTDIDAQTRSATPGWDIGADEGANGVYYSVGQSVSDLKTGIPTLDITSGAGVFSVTQTGNIGVGDRVTYNTSQIAYIAAKTNSDGMHWTLITATGGTPADVTGATVNSIAREYTHLETAIANAYDSNHINDADLTSANVVLNIPCYYDSSADDVAVSATGYTTSVPNYIKIYTPNNTSTEANFSQRHQGTWDDGKYKLVSSVSWGGILTVSEPYFIIDGIQIENQASRANGPKGIIADATATTNSSVKISNNIVRSTGGGSSNNSDGICISSMISSSVWNNFVYDWGKGIRYGYIDTAVNINIHNNTVVNSTEYGIECTPNGTPNFRLYNNLVQDAAGNYNVNFVDNSGNNISFNNSSPNSGGTDCGGHSCINQTVSFVDSTDKDFHLSLTDASAKNAGADLSADSYFAFSTDVDGQTRSGLWDIGADEGATNVFYSVGQNLNDHKTGNPTVTVSGTIATFSVAQTATNMGVGDVVDYDSDNKKCYISGKSSTTVWSCVSVTGGTPTAATGVTVNSITHDFNNLMTAITGASGALHLNTADLVSANVVLNIPCYYDTGSDTAAVTVDGYVTGPNNYIKIYTPNDTSTEVNQSQRHQGKWDDGKYSLEKTTTGQYQWPIEIIDDYVWLDGLQFFLQYSHDNSRTIEIATLSSGNNSVKISNNILKGETSGNDLSGIGLRSSAQTNRVYAWNNIAYGFRDSDGTHGVGFRISGTTAGNEATYYNNTAYGNAVGFSDAMYESGVLKNNLAYDNDTDFSGTFDSLCEHNISSDATSPNSGATDCGGHSCRNQTVLFTDSANFDFHLSNFDTAARDAGTNLSADADLAFENDVDGQMRNVGGAWDIGADESGASVLIKGGVKIDGGVKVQKN